MTPVSHNLNSSPILMSLVKVPVKAGGAAKRNASIEQGTQVSTATQRAATTIRHRHTEKLSGDTYQTVYLPWSAKREGRGGANCHTNAQMHKCKLEIARLPERVRVI